MHSMRNPLAAAAAALALAACGPQPAPESEQPVEAPTEQPTGAAVETPAELDPLFAQAAEEFNVPADLLKAISFTETRWQMVQGEEEFEGMPAAFGLMALRGERLEHGARLAGVSVDLARKDALANVRAGAALLSAYADELKLERADLGAWAPAAARFSGIELDEAQAEYIHRGVYKLLREGAVAENGAGGVLASVMPSEVEAQFAPMPVRAMAAGPDYAASIWRPSPNYNSRPSGTDVSMIVIHTCEGGYSGCWGWLTNSASGVSAHYVVNESGSEISQLVRESHRAWHVGASYSCSLNSSVLCGNNGVSVNHFSVGIEHGGYASQSSFPTGQIDASAKLSCDISKGQGIPRDRYHIVAHGKLQPASRTDPGPNWPWTTYLNKINSYCGSGGGGGTTSIVVDSNNANNNTAVARMSVSSVWASSSGSPGYYGSGYYFASTQPVSDPASFEFYLPSAGSKTIDVWYTAGSNRSTAAPFIAFNAAGTKLGTAYVNQQANGGKWVTIGTWNFSSGWNKVQLSRWAPEGYVVIADAIRVR